MLFVYFRQTLPQQPIPAECEEIAVQGIVERQECGEIARQKQDVQCISCPTAEHGLQRLHVECV
ncbi:hypothetical protein D9M72_376680 [compost metagenome]